MREREIDREEEKGRKVRGRRSSPPEEGTIKISAIQSLLLQPLSQARGARSVIRVPGIYIIKPHEMSRLRSARELKAASRVPTVALPAITSHCSSVSLVYSKIVQPHSLTYLHTNTRGPEGPAVSTGAAARSAGLVTRSSVGSASSRK